ncbi:MAG: Gx transporter family protein, partial [Clostridia bacterium]|nr:Gx transporter family protein [Clostridia bacterium]
GSLTSFLFSLTGGLLCYLVTLVLKLVVKPKQIWVLGVVGAIFHNLGQIVVAMGLTKTTGLLVYLPVLVAAGIGTGLFTGLVAQSCYLALRKHPILEGLKGGVERAKEPADLPTIEDTESRTEQKNLKNGGED